MNRLRWEPNTFFLLSQIRPSGLFPFRTDLKLWILQTVVRTPWTGDHPVARPLPTQDNTKADIHPCLEWDTNPRSQCSSGWRHFVPFTARPLRTKNLPNTNLDHYRYIYLLGRRKCSKAQQILKNTATFSLASSSHRTRESTEWRMRVWQSPVNKSTSGQCWIRRRMGCRITTHSQCPVIIIFIIIIKISYR
jgi:hypothetical protein